MASSAPTGAAAHPVGPAAGPDRRRWTVLALLAVVQFMFALDMTIVNPALPAIQRVLSFSTSGLTWVVNGYALMAGGFLIVAGRTADLFGRRRVFVAGAIVFALASALSGLARDSAMLVVARFAQGLGEAFAGPAALSLVLLLFTDPRERAKAIGIWGAIAGMGITLGLVISGIIVDGIGWRWIFLVNIPVAGIVLAMIPRLVPESRAGSGRIDYPGALLVTGGVTLAVDGLLNASTHGWGSGAVLIPLLAGVALLAGFAVTQAVARNPLVPRRFFRNRTRVSANFATVLGVAGFFTNFFSMTLYMQGVLHYSALRTSLAWAPFGLMLFVGLGAAAQILPRFGVRAGLVFAYVVSAAGLFLLGGIGVHSHYASGLLPGMLLVSFAMSIIFIGLQNSALHRLGQSDAGVGSAVQSTFTQLGGSIGLAVLVTIALRHALSQAGHGTSPPVAATDGYALALRLAAAVMIAGAVLVAVTFEKVSFTAPGDQPPETTEISGITVAPRPPGGRRQRTTSRIAPAEQHSGGAGEDLFQHLDQQEERSRHG